MVVQALLAFGILLTFHPLAIRLGVGSLALVAVYPFAKRFTWWPQVFLGLAFNWGALLCWAAVTGGLATAPLALWLAGIAWTLFYDTIYAHQDKEDDALIGVSSTALLFGDDTRRWLRWFMAATVVMMGVAVVSAYAPGRNVLALVLALGRPWALGWHLAWQLRRLDTSAIRRAVWRSVSLEPRCGAAGCAVSRRRASGLTRVRLHPARRHPAKHGHPPRSPSSSIESDSRRMHRAAPASCSDSRAGIHPGAAFR